MIKLHPEQDYVFDIASRLGIKFRLVPHTRSTDTCEEKLGLYQEYKEQGLLQYVDLPEVNNLDQMVKALFFTASEDEPFIGIITPEIGRLNPKQIIQDALGYSGKQARAMTRKSDNGTPTGMEKGTCTPFPYESTMRTEISHLLIIPHPRSETIITDISVGGKDHEASMLIPYQGIIDILKEQFGRRIKVLDPRFGKLAMYLG